MDSLMDMLYFHQMYKNSIAILLMPTFMTYFDKNKKKKYKKQYKYKL